MPSVASDGNSGAAFEDSQREAHLSFIRAFVDEGFAQSLHSHGREACMEFVKAVLGEAGLQLLLDGKP